MCAICTAYRVWWEVIDVVQVVAGRLPTSNLRSIKTSDFFIAPLKYLQGTHEGSQRHGCEVGWVLVLVAVMTKVQVEVVWEMTDVI